MAAKVVSVPLEPLSAPEQVLQGGVRLDGRGYEEFRPVFVSTKTLSQATGSAYAEFANTKVMVAVYGPRQSERKFGFTEQGRLNCEVTCCSWSTKQRSRQGKMTAERDMATAITTAIESSVNLAKFPKSVVDVYVCIMESGGADAAVAITAASMALVDAGIEVYDLVPACCVSLVDGQLLLDPSSTETSRQQGGLLLAFGSSANEVTQMQLTGSWSNSQLRDAVELAMGGCMQLKAMMRQVLLDAAAASRQDQ